MIVVAIVSVLVAIALPQYLLFTAKSKGSEGISQPPSYWLMIGGQLDNDIF